MQRSEAAAGAADVILFVCSSPEGWTGADHDVFVRVLGHGQRPGQGQGQGQREGQGQGQSQGQGQGQGTSPNSWQSGHHESSGEPSGIPLIPAILVSNKSDLARPDWATEPVPENLPEHGHAEGQGKLPGAIRGRFRSVVATSAATGGGLDDLDRAVLEALGAGGAPVGGRAWTVNEVRRQY